MFLVSQWFIRLATPGPRSAQSLEEVILRRPHIYQWDYMQNVWHAYITYICIYIILMKSLHKFVLPGPDEPRAGHEEGRRWGERRWVLLLQASDCCRVHHKDDMNILAIMVAAWTMGAVCEPYVHMLPFDLCSRTWGKHVKQLANLDNGEEVAKDLLRL